MRFATGKVRAGKIVVEGEPFEEGTSVAVIGLDESGHFDLTAAQEAELLEAIAEADRGELVDAAIVLRNLQRRS